MSAPLTSFLFFSEECSHSNGSSSSLRRRSSHSHCSQLCSEMSCLSWVRSFRKGISAHARVSSVTRQMRKQFCPECGNPSLQRASITVDSSGQHHYHLTGRYRPQPRVSTSRIDHRSSPFDSISAIVSVASRRQTFEQSDPRRRPAKTAEPTDEKGADETSCARRRLCG